jgi:hypothetical protein
MRDRKTCIIVGLVARIAGGEADAVWEDLIHMWALARAAEGVPHGVADAADGGVALRVLGLDLGPGGCLGFVGRLLQLGRRVDGCDRGRQPFLRGDRDLFSTRQCGAHRLANVLLDPSRADRPTLRYGPSESASGSDAVPVALRRAERVALGPAPA